MPTVITGTDGINQVQAGAVESGDLPAGSVVQVVRSVVVDNNVSTTSTNYVPTGLSASITPISESNSIVIMTHQHADTESERGLLVSLFRDSTDLSGSSFGFVLIGDIDRTQGVANIVFEDNPNTTSTITYSTKFKSRSGGLVRMPVSDNMPFTMVLMEIAV